MMLLPGMTPPAPEPEPEKEYPPFRYFQEIGGKGVWLVRFQLQNVGFYGRGNSREEAEADAKKFYDLKRNERKR